jgi:hypothetical protein
VSIQGLYVDHRKKVITIPDVFHPLHCLVCNRVDFITCVTEIWQGRIQDALNDPGYHNEENVKVRMHVSKRLPLALSRIKTKLTRKIIASIICDNVANAKPISHC